MTPHRGPLTVTLTVAAVLAATPAAAHADPITRSVTPNPDQNAGLLVTTTGETRAASVRISGRRTVHRGRAGR